jgi:hypothetical protein
MGGTIANITHHCGDKRKHHESKHNAGRQNAKPVGAAAKQEPHQRHRAQQFLHGHLKVIGKQGRKDKQTKHAVDDGRHCSQ